MGSNKEKKRPPIWIMIIVFFSLYLLISIFLTLFLRLPWNFPIHPLLGIVVGISLLAIGFFILINTLKSLTIKRVFGKEIFKSKDESKLVTTGIYAYTRNPLYLGSTILFLGWFFVFLLTFILIMTLLFLIMFYFVAKWEEKELTERFGEEYLCYKNTVHFFLPYPKRQCRNNK